MQTLSNVLNLPIKVATSTETCALGSAINAAVVCKLYKTVPAAQKKIGSSYEKAYLPNPDLIGIYVENFKKYDTFGKS